MPIGGLIAARSPILVHANPPPGFPARSHRASHRRHFKERCPSPRLCDMSSPWPSNPEGPARQAEHGASMAALVGTVRRLLQDLLNREPLIQGGAPRGGDLRGGRTRGSRARVIDNLRGGRTRSCRRHDEAEPRGRRRAIGKPCPAVMPVAGIRAHPREGASPALEDHAGAAQALDHQAGVAIDIRGPARARIAIRIHRHLPFS